MFIRTKIIKGKEYAYKVENIWRKRKKASRQKVGKYLGRVYTVDKEKDLNFMHVVKKDLDKYLSETDYYMIIKDLILKELLNHGFVRKKYSKYKYVKDGLMVDLKYKKVFNDKEKECVLRMNEGFLCNTTMKGLLNFKGEGSEREIGQKLANNLVEAGLVVDQDVFLALFDKIGKLNYVTMQEEPEYEEYIEEKE
ncbi:hypothetical protein DRJ17_03595 [Candidatus Woesearchaeota archaeon]|nr:MAG: hypothetical protein DRJ17_03595 [Candidatus Woesearchaeota archaeon]